ncbi:MAG: bifunctional riboflavin kinase/FAD synthetase [Hyphomicrobiaceae bacterium]|nr:bifunctional riboflavin kinase/FAD synthetase [Hyphomicrobiaceae bacterium]
MDQSVGGDSLHDQLIEAGQSVPGFLRGAVVAIGNFDGVHRGHQAVLAEAEALAEPDGRPVALLTFEPHPRIVLGLEPDLFILTPPPVKARVVSALGLAGVVIERFDAGLAGLSPEDFVVSVLAARLRPKGVVVGAGFRFGAKRAGDASLLRRLGHEYGFAVAPVAPFSGEDRAVVSSSRIRMMLKDGDVTGAAGLLGYRWFIEGPVVHGEKRGRTLGFPTANIELPENCGLRHGIYAVSVCLDGTVYRGAASYGRRPTFGDKPPLLEVYLMDFSGDLYGHTLDVVFHAFLRGEEKFDSAEALVARMGQDVAEANAVLAAARPLSPLDLSLGLSIPEV